MVRFYSHSIACILFLFATLSIMECDAFHVETWDKLCVIVGNDTQLAEAEKCAEIQPKEVSFIMGWCLNPNIILILIKCYSLAQQTNL